jgi:acyl dehydratase
VEKLNAIQQLAEDWKKQIGTVYTKGEIEEVWSGSGFNSQATRDTIKHFVDGIGDLNPLYRNPDYARRTKYKRLLAPPCFLYSSVLAPIPHGLGVPKGILGWDSGAAWRWFRPLCEGDEIEYRVICPTDVQLKQSKHGGGIAVLHGAVEYARQGGELVSIYNYWIIWAEVEERKYEDVAKAHEYTEKEIEEIQAAQDREAVRGQVPRYWEAVGVGDELTPVVRGPYTMYETIAWAVGGIGAVCDRVYRLKSCLAKEKGGYVSQLYDPILKINLNPQTMHFDSNWARKRGLPGAIAYGSQIASWLAMLVTNWMGDDGFLWKLRVEIRGFLVAGDTAWCKGKVVRKYIESGRHCLDIELSAVNQSKKVLSAGLIQTCVGTLLTKWNKLSKKPVRQILKVGRLCLEVPGLIHPARFIMSSSGGSSVEVS